MKSNELFPLFKYAKKIKPGKASGKNKASAPASTRRELDPKEKSITFEQLMAYQRDAEKQYDLPEKMLAMVAYLESKGDLAAVSNKGALGLYQLLPKVIKDPGKDPSKKDKTAYYISDFKNIKEMTFAVAEHLSNARARMLGLRNVDKYVGLGFDKGWELVALEYIAGQGNVQQWLDAGAPIDIKLIDSLVKQNKYTSGIRGQSIQRLYDMTRQMQSGSFNEEQLRPKWEESTGQKKTV